MATSELKTMLLQRCNKEQYKFIPFSPVDNTDQERHTTGTILRHNEQLLIGLLEMKFVDYISHWMWNESLNKFLFSFLLYRNRPVDIVEAGAPNIFNFDKYVFLLFLRLVSDEYLSLSALVDQSTDLKQQYALLLHDCRTLCLANIISLGCIMGDTNIAHFRKLIAGLSTLYPYILAETTVTMMEVEASVCQVHDVLASACDSKKKSSTRVHLSSKPRPKTTSQTEKTKANPAIDWDNVLDMSEFLLDICYWLSMYMQGFAPLLHNDCVGLFMADGSFVTATGQRVLRSLLAIYEQTLPTVENMICTQVLSSSASVSVLSRVNELVRLCRMRIIQSMFLACTIACVPLDVSVAMADAGTCAYIPLSLAVDISAVSIPDLREKGGNGIDVGKEDESSLLLPWMEVIVSMVSGGTGLGSTGGGVTRQGTDWPPASGMLLADVVLVYGTTMRTFLTALFSHEESGRRSYLLEAIGSSEGYFASEVAKATEPSKVHRNVYAPTDISPKKTLAESAGDEGIALQAMIDMVQGIFPDYGGMFIAAALKEYENDAERTIDALLSDNISPGLRSMDRTLKTAWMGKTSAETSSSFEMSATDRRAQKERLRKLEEDSRILQAEYGDDYDDQFDDAGLETLGPFGGNAKPGTGGSLKKASNWEEERRRVLRLNALIRGEEEEGRFWAGLANTNTKKGNKRIIAASGEDCGTGVNGGAAECGDVEEANTSGGEAESKSERGGRKGNKSAPALTSATRGAQVKGVPSAATSGSSGGGNHKRNGGHNKGNTANITKGGSNDPRSQRQHRDSSVKADTSGGKRPSGGDGEDAVAGARPGAGGVKGSNRTNKPRTKTFDKHHQKDKSSRKFGGFNPS